MGYISECITDTKRRIGENPPPTSEKSVIFTKEYRDKSNDVKPWTKEVVFKIYCNDNLYELPVGILEQMRDYIENIIDNKKEIEI